ncbi:DUF1059 domain-containing protein [Candidatus Uhrbacteria bacterium]|nr:DUF1059 domain-containing protein [Candidatus Uhrbacteria bacterium]
MAEIKQLKAIYCRDFGYDCNAVMKGRNPDEAIDAVVKHFVSMHGNSVRDLQTPEKRAEIGAKIKDWEAPPKNG